MLQSSLLCGQPTVMEAILSEYRTFLSRGASYQRKFLGRTKQHTKLFAFVYRQGVFRGKELQFMSWFAGTNAQSELLTEINRPEGF